MVASREIVSPDETTLTTSDIVLNTSRSKIICSLQREHYCMAEREEYETHVAVLLSIASMGVNSVITKESNCSSARRLPRSRNWRVRTPYSTRHEAVVSVNGRRR